jgi:hypothetical protein
LLKDLRKERGLALHLVKDWAPKYLEASLDWELELLKGFDWVTDLACEMDLGLVKLYWVTQKGSVLALLSVQEG